MNPKSVDPNQNVEPYQNFDPNQNFGEWVGGVKVENNATLWPNLKVDTFQIFSWAEILSWAECGNISMT